MSIHNYKKRRSIKSYFFEKYLFLRGTKEGFSSIENTKKFIAQRGIENTKPYVIENVTFSSTMKEQTIDGIKVFTLNDQNSLHQKVILYIHGGAWTNQPLKFHWRFMDNLAQSLNAKVIAPIYPKVPHFNYKHTYPQVLNLYKEILESVESPKQLTIMGDSAGGNISLGLAQLLKLEGLSQPKDIILFSACVDMVLDNPHIPGYEKIDPMLSVGGMPVITKIWADDKKLDDPLISPIYGDFSGLTKVTHFIGTHEGLYPDALLFDEKLSKQGVEINTFVYPKMNHVFVIMPIPEAKDAQQKIINIIRKD
ncbi:alpha/beta hydrolase [Salipaludibacillus agaradhaerens]|uniref:alpha/beta hydrolase fold domain-containing protein n=1 Tax=Salipaludibacillus agaradhaerens TaxID=76935 RepID=UPI002150AFA1|nr:alpha/beta hydrolase [Salipaludibacillus agaradhaerens]MCR6108504.1 alpha/beta hydrolase [Salipaludibacillus agaradhaerens]MCR6120525.1 alpha/beta hydrolase [Salipaludibacillus agaradhaerens]